jgi:hypothetical protein
LFFKRRAFAIAIVIGELEDPGAIAVCDIAGKSWACREQREQGQGTLLARSGLY